MVFVGSPDQTAWTFRLVYLSDADEYDLVPEYRFSRANLSESVEYAGAAVQDLRVDSRVRDGGEGEDVSAEGGGVRILMLGNTGMAKWWTVRREHTTEVGVDEIVV